MISSALCYHSGCVISRPFLFLARLSRIRPAVQDVIRGIVHGRGRHGVGAITSDASSWPGLQRWIPLVAKHLLPNILRNNVAQLTGTK